MLTDVDIGSGSVRFAKDYVGVDYHNEGHSHIDAFCHVAYDGMLYGGIPDAEVTSRGAVAGAIDLLRDGLVGRGCSSTYPASEASAGSSGASTCSPTTSTQQRGRRASASRPATSSSSAPDTRTVSPSLRRGTRASARPACTRARPDSSQADASPPSGPMETTTRPRAPPKGVAYPIHVLALNAMGSTCSTTCSSRTLSRVRGGRAVGVPRRRLTAANRGRHRFAGQPDRDPLTRVHLQRRSSRRGPRGGRKTGSHVRIDEHGDHASRGVTRSRSLPPE